ncbi:MAG: peptide-methionine (S)-S-oxide reductase [Maribacter sp.]|nr:peptide-methionine (S)-S-oxide reductase [Maribacter sp.]
MLELKKIGFGGGCHWCTEAVFQSLIGVSKVEQGFIASTGENSSFSEAVIVHYNPNTIPLHLLVEIHLRTHKSTVNHQMRSKYRSAIYVFSKGERNEVKQMLLSIQKEYAKNLIVLVLLFHKFKPSEEQFANYYYKNPKKPFCINHIDPKLRILLKQFSNQVNMKKLNI